MAHSVVVELELPEELEAFRLPKAVDQRLQHLLDQQDSGIELSPEERAEAEGLVSLAETLSLLRMRAQRVQREGEDAPYSNGTSTRGKAAGV